MVADNATTHSHEMRPFMELVNADPEFTTCLVPIGNGEFVAVRGKPPPCVLPHFTEMAISMKWGRKRQLSHLDLVW